MVVPTKQTVSVEGPKGGKLELWVGWILGVEIGGLPRSGLE